MSISIGILIIPLLAVTLTFRDGMLDNHLLSLWIMTVFSSNLFVFVGIGIIDGKRFWEELRKSDGNGNLSGEVFDFCYTPADFQFINEQVNQYCPDKKSDPEEMLSKIYIAYRDLNLSDYRKFILVTHLAKQHLSSKDEFWQSYNDWGLDSGDYDALKRFSFQYGRSEAPQQPATRAVRTKSREAGWRPRML
ncbi:MAG TPA: hypothetical protein ENO22_03605 [candidate division Zixibacteria bacterium]|nr:hypothetical protein [candidate division Zixibacteria bacterium]